MGFQNCIGIPSRLCQGKVKRLSSLQMSPRGQQNSVAVNVWTASCVFNRPDLSRYCLLVWYASLNPEHLIQTNTFNKSTLKTAIFLDFM